MRMLINGKLAALVLVCTGLMATAGALDNVVIDENGNGTWVDSNNLLHEFHGTRTDDPSGGVLTALVYSMTPFTFSLQGDYEIYTPDTHELAGLVRFWGNNTMIFYDNDAGLGTSDADQSGIPAGRLGFVMGLNQALIGDPSFTFVTPSDGMAGFDGGDRQYTFLSVLPVPEPCAGALVACGAILLALRRRKQPSA